MIDLVSNVASNLVTNGISKLVLGNDKMARTEAATSDEQASAQDSKGSKADFDSVLSSFLPADSSAQVSEEELFSATAAERIQKLKGDDALEKYREALDAEKLALTKPDGYVPVEQATVNALKKLVADGVLSKEEGDQVYTEAFQGAQLDGNADSLFDNRGSENDPTVAVGKLSEVMTNIKSFFERVATTPLSTESLMSLETASATGGGNAVSTLASSALFTGVSAGHVDPQGTTVDGSEGFLFKPVTNNEGKLAVMFAQSWTGNIAGVRLLDSAGNLLENGTHKPEGTAETGREKYTFSQPGGSYPQNITVEVAFNDGTVKTYSIPDPSKRYD